MRNLIFVAVLLVHSTVAVMPARGQAPGAEEPLADQVRKAIDSGVRYLRRSQDSATGNWERSVAAANIGLEFPGGQTALALLALLNAGVKADDQVVVKGLNYLRSLEMPPTYVRALQTMVLVQAGQKEDIERIDTNVRHLQKIATRDKEGRLLGWGYDRNNIVNGLADNSNTQYALLALGTARQAKIDIPPAFWEEVRAFYTRTQNGDGSWNYHPDTGTYEPRLTMTMAGVCGLLVCQMELSHGREKLDPVAICGIYDENVPLVRGLSWITKPPPEPVDRFTINLKGYGFYNLYGIERLGRLSGVRFFGAHDWYREGCRWLVDHQNKQTGEWREAGLTDQYATISTSFALLFLSKGRTPVLITKLSHGNEPRQSNDQDWNRRRNDLRHLVEFTSDTVFQKLPLAWQTFDIFRALEAAEPGKRTDSEVAAQLLQSPIVYLSGHGSPELRLKQREQDILKKYVENGGFILAVACCGSPEFDRGFKQLCEKLFPDNELTTLTADHPVWNMRFQVKPGSFDLKGIQFGCKTVLIYSPQNLCGYWEINRQKDDGIGTDAFRLGANIAAYATGLEAPVPRGTLVEIQQPAREAPLASAPRGYFQAGQLISRLGEEADWRPAPEAMSRLMQNLREKTGLDVVLKTAAVTIDHAELANFKFLYMHGRKDFRFSSNQLERLRFNLSHGGLLFADACCGQADFDKAFRRFVDVLFPAEAFPAAELPRLVPIPAGDGLYSKDLNGEALTETNIRCRLQRGSAPKAIRPALEGIKIGKRWAVIYSKYDIGCALESHQGADCVGYTTNSALLLGRAAVLYQFYLEGARPLLDK